MLQVFKSIPIVREVVCEEALPSTARGYARDVMTLGWEERVRARGRRRSGGGLEFATVLRSGTVLRGGDCLVVHEARTVVVVAERDEPVFVVAPSTPEEWGLYAYQIGNSHQPIMVTVGGIVCPDVPGMEQLLVYHGIPFSRAMRPFTPVGGAADHRHRIE